jgi:hypothetical protein
MNDSSVMSTRAAARSRMAAVMVAAVLLASCGSDGSGESTEGTDTTTTMPATTTTVDAELRDEYLDALVDAGLGASSRAGDRCIGEALLDVVGVSRLQEAEIDPDDFADAEHLEELDITLEDEELTSLGEGLGACMRDEVGPMLEQMMAVEFTDEVFDCMVRGFAPELGAFAAGAFATGDNDLNRLSAASTLIGLNCRWETASESPESSVVLADGESEFIDAVIAEATAVPVVGGNAEPAALGTASECFVPKLIEVLGDQIDDGALTARQVAMYVSGVSPNDVGLEVSETDASRLADEMMVCVDLRELVRDALSLFANDLDDAQLDAVIDCVAEEITEDDTRALFVLQFEDGLAGLQTPEGQRLNEREIRAGATCAAEVLEGG